MKAVLAKSERHPSLSPDNLEIVFSVGKGFDRDLFIVNLNTAEVRSLTVNDFEDSHPRWSPDGQWIVFQREDTIGNRDLYLIKPDGTQERNITNTENFREQHPSFSSDGNKVIFDSNRDELELDSNSQNYEIYTIDLNTNEIDRLTRWNEWDMYPSFSPDESHITWRRTVRKDETNRQDFEIFVKSLETGEEWSIAESRAYDSNPHWNPSRDLITFSSTRNGSSNIYTIKPDGTELKMITQAVGRSIGFGVPVFSFDGEKVVADRFTKDVTDMVVIYLSDSIN